MEIKGKTMSYEEVSELFDSSLQTEIGDSVILSNDEINRARRNKRKAKQNTAGFQNTPIYRSLHESMRLIIEIVQLMPRKSIKLSDILLQNYTELIRWSASAYNHQDDLLKQNALEEAISLMSVVKITLNCMSNLVSEKKHKQLLASFDAVIRQLVAWRGSLIQNQGSDDDA